MFSWNEDRIRWFDKAVCHTDFYEGIVKKCNEKGLLKDDYEVLDVGCGLGFLSIALSSYVKSVTALDISEIAIDFLEKECKKRRIANIKTLICDWKKHKPEKKYDMVFVCYCGGFGTEDFYKLAKLSKGYVIGIISNRSTGYNFGINEFSQSASTLHKKESFNSVKKFFKQNNISYQNIEHKCEFGQPIDNIEEYKRFMEHYYDINDDALLKKHSEACLKENKQGYYLPNIKHSNIIIIENPMWQEEG